MGGAESIKLIPEYVCGGDEGSNSPLCILHLLPALVSLLFNRPTTSPPLFLRVLLTEVGNNLGRQVEVLSTTTTEARRVRIPVTL